MLIRLASMTSVRLNTCRPGCYSSEFQWALFRCQNIYIIVYSLYLIYIIVIFWHIIYIIVHLLRAGISHDKFIIYLLFQFVIPFPHLFYNTGTFLDLEELNIAVPGSKIIKKKKEYG